MIIFRCGCRFLAIFELSLFPLNYARVAGVCVVALLALLMTIPAAVAGEVELSRVKAEWPVAAQRLEQMFASVKGTARVWNENSLSSAQPVLDEDHFAADHGMEKVEITRLNQASPPVKLGHVVYCVGEGTSFELRSREDKKYTVGGIGATQRDADRYLASFGQYFHAHNGVLGIPMPRFLNSPGFNITAAEAISEAGKSLIRVECVSGLGNDKARASLVLDPDGGWVVRSSRFQRTIRRSNNKPNPVIAFDVEYGSSRNGIPLPRLVKTQRLPSSATVAKGKPGVSVNYCEFTDWTFDSTPSSEFTMTHYGMPDLVHAAQQPRSKRLYLLLGNAVLVAVVAIGLWRRGSRDRGLSPA